jgi:hypothetical protein
MLYNIEEQVVSELMPENVDRSTLARWRDVKFVANRQLSFTFENNLGVFSIDTRRVEWLTSDGTADVLNGAHAWLYEEEIFGDGDASRWTDDARFVAYLQANETDVPLRAIAHYARNASFGDRLTQQRADSIRDRYTADALGSNVWFERYPRVRDANPLVSLFFVDTTAPTPRQRISSPCTTLHYITQFEFINDTALLIVSVDRDYQNQLQQ